MHSEAQLPDLTDTYLKQIEAVLGEYRNWNNGTFHGTRKYEAQRLITLCRAVVHRVAGSGEPYATELSNLQKGASAILIPRLVGVVAALQADLKAGYLKTAAELIHGEIFGDFLEMGEHLLNNGYKDAAAVVAGSTLEAHLRQLCQKFGIETEVESGKGKLRAKKADRMNSDLNGASAYTSKLDQKSVTAWLGLRNKAAHGEYGAYSSEQVALLNHGVRDFISRNPA